MWRFTPLVILLLLSQSAIAQGSGSVSEQKMIVGDSQLRVTLSGAVEVLPISGLSGVAWSAQIDGTVVEPGNAHITRSGPGNPAQFAVLEGSIPQADWKMEYRVTGPGRITKTLTFTARTDFTLNRVALWSAKSPQKPVVSSTSLQDIAAFYRQDKTGLFVSLDFPYSKIETEKETATVSYPASIKLKAGESFACESLTFGATLLTGRTRYGFDEGEVEAMDSYVQERFKPRFNRPMFITGSIVNRYTQIDGDIVWYTMRDHPSLSFNQDLMKREIALMEKLGMEYYQVFPGPFDSVPGDPDPNVVKDIVAYAKRRHMRVGDYSASETLFCPHYNEYRNSLENHPEWGIEKEDVCFGNPRFVDFYINMVVPTCKKYGYELHIMDYLNIHPCDNPAHGHPLGRDSIYAQVKGLTRLQEAINAVSPKMMIWSNAGNWAEFLPKLAWTNHNLYLTDPYIGQPWQGLNMTRLLDDVRREQMVSLHYSRFVPYRFFTNCQYFFIQNSIVPDIRNYKYGALSTIAVTPNLSLCEVRPWIDRLNARDQKEVIGFYHHWTEFLKKHFDLWTKTYHCGDNPGMGSVEIYSHAKGGHGFVFVINPQYWDRTVEIPLDSTLGFTTEGKCEIEELHPVERLRLTEQGPFAAFGGKVSLRVPAQQVIVLEIKPAAAKIDKPRLYGIPGSISETEDGYLLNTHGPQGTTERFAVLLPNGNKPITDVSVRDVPKQPKRLWAPTPIKLLASDDKGALLEITYRRTPAPTELRDWSVKPGKLDDALGGGFADGEPLRFPLFVDAQGVELPMWDETAKQLGLGPLANFCGAYVENAFGETQETSIDLKTSGKSTVLAGELANIKETPVLHPLPTLAKTAGTGWWLQTKFHLPFMYQYGSEPAVDEHTLLVLPFLRRGQVKQIKAWINGKPLDALDYRYPRNRTLGCYYADLVGSGAHGGENVVVVYYEVGTREPI